MGSCQGDQTMKSVASFAAIGLTQMLLAELAYAQLSNDDIAALRLEGQAKGWTFKVVRNPATERPLGDLCGYKRPADWPEGARFDPCEPKLELPDAFDWRALGGCTVVKDQGSCGSCWAFGTVGPLECNILIKDGVEVDLSEQWLVSCNQDGWGCNGGSWAHAYHLCACVSGKTDPCGHCGAVPEADFPYVASDVPCNCPYPHSYCIEHWAYISGGTNAIKQAIMDYGPVSSAVYVTSAFMAYGGGIFNNCESGIPNHAITLVGWDDNQGPSGVWFLRNSWGTGWGEDGGYMRIPYGCSEVGSDPCYVFYRESDDLRVDPVTGFVSRGEEGGPFEPECATYTLTNNGTDALDWTAEGAQPWLDVTPGSGTLAGGNSTTVDVCINANANSLPTGIYYDTVTFTNVMSGHAQTRSVTLRAGQIDHFTELFNSNDNDLDNLTVTFTPDGSASFYHACTGEATAFPTDPSGGTALPLSDDDYESVSPSGGQVSLYGSSYSVFYVGSNGYITFTAGDTEYNESIADHFSLPRISGLYDDLNPSSGGTVSWKELGDRVAVTYENVPEYGPTGSNSFQVEMFFNGTIRITWLAIGATDGLAGLSGGNGIPLDFEESDLSGYPACVPDDLSVVPTTGFYSSGCQGGPFTPQCKTYTLTNTNPDPLASLDWTADATEPWLDVPPVGGTLAGGESTTVNACINGYANSLPRGTYTSTATFTNLTSGTAQPRNVQLIVWDQTPWCVLDVDFESGLDDFVIDNSFGDGNGLWHLTTACQSAAGSHSTPTSLYFGVDAQCDYDSGLTAEGVVTSSVISLAGLPLPIELRFNYFLQTEGSPSQYDMASVELSENGGPFNVVAHNNPGLGVVTLADPSSEWQEAAVDLSAMAGSDIQIRLRFRTFDSWVNNFDGFYVDDVRVCGLPPPQLLSAVSRKAHAPASDLDIGLPLDPPEQAGVETRSGGPTRVILTFTDPVKAIDGVPDHTEVHLSAGTLGSVSILNNADREMTIEMSGVPDETCLRIWIEEGTIANLAETPLVGDHDLHILVLCGDTNSDGSTDLIDIAQVKSMNGQPTDEVTVRFDLNLDGNIDLIDMALAKSRNGNSASCP